MKKFNVIGAGLAGTEAAWQIANVGEKVTLFEQKPLKNPPLIGRTILQNSCVPIL